MLNDSARNRHNNNIYICTLVLDEVLKISSESPYIRFVLRNLLLLIETRLNSKCNEIVKDSTYVEHNQIKMFVSFYHDNPFLTYHLVEIIKILHYMQY